MGILREPLLHFLVLGAVVYVAANHGESTQYQIDAGSAQRARLARTYLEQYGVPPTVAQLDRAVDEYVRNEILYREGLAMGLERDDEIVRRRVVQKIEFVNEDLDAAAVPDATGIERYFAQHQDRYVTDPMVSFEQLFFSSDRGGDTVARKRAETALAAAAAAALADAAPADHRRPIQAATRDATRDPGVTRGSPSGQSIAGSRRGVLPERGRQGGDDTFAEGREFHALTRTGANSLFGETELTAALFTSPTSTTGTTSPTGQWAGPFKSAYGWHLVRITDRQPAQHAELAAVRARVQADYIADLRARANADAFRKIASKYRVVTDGADSATAHAASTPADELPAVADAPGTSAAQSAADSATARAASTSADESPAIADAPGTSAAQSAADSATARAATPWAPPIAANSSNITVGKPRV